MAEYKDLTLEIFNKFMDDLKNQPQQKPFELPTSEECDRLGSNKSYMMSDGSIFNGGTVKELNKEIMKSVNVIKRDENGFPLLDNGEIDWELTQKEKCQVLKEHEKYMREDGCKKIRRKITNFTPKKKIRK